MGWRGHRSSTCLSVGFPVGWSPIPSFFLGTVGDGVGGVFLAVAGSPFVVMPSCGVSSGVVTDHCFFLPDLFLLRVRFHAHLWCVSVVAGTVSAGGMCGTRGRAGDGVGGVWACRVCGALGTAGDGVGGVFLVVAGSPFIVVSFCGVSSRVVTDALFFPWYSG